MQELVRRLIDSGMSRSVAICVLRQIHDPRDRELYVEEIEEKAHEQMETV